MVFFILFLVNSVIVTINNIQLTKNPKLLSNKSTTDEIILTTKNAVKRPAPSYDVLMKLRDALKLNDDEFGEMLDLAAESKNSRAVAYDLADYINQNDFIHKTLRFSLKNKIPESEWVRFFNAMNEKYQ